MKRTILILTFLVLTIFVEGQDPLPSDTAKHALPTYSFSFYTRDSSVYIYKGVKYGYTKLISNRKARQLIDSLGRSNSSAFKLKVDTINPDGYVPINRLTKQLALKRSLTDHDSLSNLDEKSYNSLTDKPIIGDTATVGQHIRNKTDAHDLVTRLNLKVDKVTGQSLIRTTFRDSIPGQIAAKVNIDQSTPQTVGVTGARLAKLWATDITVTNAITGSVTGNAGTVTNGVYTNDARLTDARTPTSHAHGNITNAGLIGTTASLPIITGTGGILQTGSFGSTAGTFLEGRTFGTAANFEYPIFSLPIAASTDITTTYDVATWGDSMTAGQGGTPYPTQLATLTGLTVFNGGVGGESSTGIRNRMIADTGKHGWPTIIWAGRNNFSDSTTIKADIAIMVAALGHTNYLIISVCNAASAGEEKGGVEYLQITSLNNALKRVYGGRYLDIRSYLISNYDPSNSTDVSNYIDDIIPSSFRSDHVHLNTRGYYLVAKKIFETIDKWNSGSGEIITPSLLRNLFANPIPFGSTTPNTGTFSTLTANDSIRLGGKKFNISGDNSSVHLNAKFIPLKDNTYDLGYDSGGYRWRNLFLSGDASAAKFKFINGTSNMIVLANGDTIATSTYEPAFSKNTGFNKNFGTTTGTVLEGRTFGTAANGSINDFINNNVVAQTASMNITGSGVFGYYVQSPYYVSNIETGTAPFTVTSTTLNTNLNADLLDGKHGSSYQPALNGTGFVKISGTTISYDNSTYLTALHTIGVLTGQVWGYDSHPTTTTGYGLPAYPTTLPASDVSAWAKAGTKPSYNTSEISENTNLYYTDVRVDARVVAGITGKQNTITTGATSQYFRGDLSLATFPTVGTWGALAYPTWSSGTPFVKMTAAGTFALDANTYSTNIHSNITALNAVSGTNTGDNAVNSLYSGLVTMTYPGAGIPLSTGSAWGTSITNNSSNWNTAYDDRMKWDGGSTGLTAATGRTSLGLGNSATKDTGTGSTNVATGDHNHSGVYQPVLLSNVPHTYTANTSFSLDLAYYVNASISTNTAINCTITNMPDGGTGNITITYTGTAIVTIIVDSGYTLIMPDGVWGSTTNAYTKAMASFSSGTRTFSYYRSGNNVTILGMTGNLH